MTDYTKTTNFAAKDSLPSGNANKIVKGAEIDTEFTNIATASATKADIASPAFTGVVSFPDGSASAPSITNTGDTDTGLFFSAADTLAFSAAGTAQFTMADGAIAPVTDNDVDLGTSSLEFKDGYFDGTLYTDAINLDGTAITSTAAEINILDGVTATAAELNILDGVTSTTAELNILDGVTATTAELNIMDGVTATTAELNIMDGVTSTAAELNILDGVTSTAAELNILDGVTATTAELNYSDTGSAVGTVVASKVVTVDANKDVASFRNITLTGELDAGSLDISGDADIDGTLETDALSINGTAVTSTAAELNILDGVTSTAAELNILDGVTSTTAELNILDGVTSTAAELNILDGKAFLDEDDMSSDSATGIASQQSIKAYVDAQITAEDLDFQADSGGALSIDLDSETLTFTGGTGIDTSGSGNAVTFAIDSTVATLTGSQTLTNKTLTSPDINTPDIDGGAIDNTVIGASTAAAGSFTTFTSNGIDDNANATAVTINSDEDVLIGTATRSADTQVFTKSLTVKGTYDGTLELETGRSDGDNSGVGRMVFVMPTNNASARDVAQIASETDGSTANERGGSLIFSTKADNVDGVVQRLNINSGGDIIFYDGSGNAGFFWDSSAASLGIGLSSGISSKLHVNAEMSLGADGDNRAILGYASNAFTIGTRESSTNYFSTVTVTGGKVGIGEPSPDTLLMITGDAAALTIEDSGTYSADSVSSFIGFNGKDAAGSNRDLAYINIGQHAGGNGTGSIDFQTRISGTVASRLKIDQSGNVGIGVTPSAWGSGWVAAQVGVGSTIAGRTTDYTNTNIVSNAYFDGSNWKYLSSNTASKYYQLAGSHIWDTAASGTAGNNITFSEAMRINSSGNMGIGVTPSAWHSSWKALQLGPIGFVGSYQASTTDITALGSNVYSDGTYKYIETDEAVIYKQQNGQHIFDVANSGSADSAISWNTAMTIDNSANVGIGVVPETYDSSYDALQVGNTALIGRSGSTSETYLTANAYYDGTWKYIKTDEASLIAQSSGVLSFLNAASGSANTAISWTTAMTIDNSGNVLIGSFSSSGGSVGVKFDVGGGTSETEIQTSVNGTAERTHYRFINNNGGVGSISTNGSATAYNTSSDYRLKENVAVMTGATARLKQLLPKRFNFIADADTTVDGFLAHEVADVVPEAITGTKDGMRDEEYEVTPAVLDGDGNVVDEAVMGTRSVPDYQGIDQSKLVPLLVATIQELEARITQLENN